MSISLLELSPAAQKQVLEKLKAKQAAGALRPPAKGNKLHAEKTDGYDSKKESKRAAQLRLMEQAGEISNLREQVKFELIPAQWENGKCVERPCYYRADFTYTVCSTGEKIVEDVKGYKKGATYSVFVIKRKLMLKIYGIKVMEV